MNGIHCRRFSDTSQRGVKALQLFPILGGLLGLRFKRENALP